MKPMVKNELLKFWRQRELALGRIITIREVAKETGLNWETIKNLKEGNTTRFDDDVLATMCKFFNIEPGQPVPFLVYQLVEEEAH